MKNLCDSGVDAFIDRYCSSYSGFLADRRVDYGNHYATSIRLNRVARAFQFAGSSAGPSQVKKDVISGEKE